MRKYFSIILLVAMLGLTGCNALSNIPASEPATPELTEEEKAAIRREEQLVPLLEEAKTLALGYYYEEALECLSSVPEEFVQDAEVTDAISEYETAKDSFVPFEEPVRHIFFHSLIVDTSLAFDGDHMSNGYNYWMTTVDEFKRMLEELHKNDFVLIDIHDIEAPYVPKGKKPLVLSVDDVNYYECVLNEENVTTYNP